MTYHDIKHNAEVNELLKKGNQNLGLLGFMELVHHARSYNTISGLRRFTGNRYHGT